MFTNHNGLFWSKCSRLGGSAVPLMPSNLSGNCQIHTSAANYFL